MKVNLKGELKTEFHSVTVGDETFEVEITAPTFAQQIRDNELLTIGEGGWMESRLKASITNWRGITNEDGEPIPFSWNNLSALCAQHAGVFRQLTSLMHMTFLGLTRDAKKN